MGHRLIEDEIDRQENERDARMNIVAQNGNDGEHYDNDFKFSLKQEIKLPEVYKFNADCKLTNHDIKCIFSLLGFKLEDTSDPIAKELIKKRIFIQK